jgi:predicted nucleotidyltransferase
MEDKRTIEEIVEELRGVDEVQAVYLYGSYARGEEGPMSDIDLCVVADKELSGEGRSEIILSGSEKVDIRLFWDLPSRIRAEVNREGKELFIRDERKVRDAMWSSLKEYFDFRPFYLRQINRVLSTKP